MNTIGVPIPVCAVPQQVWDFYFGGKVMAKDVHFFHTSIASIVGIEAAVLFENIEYLVSHNRENNRNFVNGKFWTYNSARAFQSHFPYMSERTISYNLKKLEKYGLIETGIFNEEGFNRTKWYTVTKTAYCILQKCKMEDTNLSNGKDKIVTCSSNNIYNNIIENTETNTETNTEADMEADMEATKVAHSIKNRCSNLFNAFWKLYPKKVSKIQAEKAFNRINPSDALYQKMIEALKKQMQTSAWTKNNGEFVPYPATWLNNKRWEDKVEIEHTKQTSTDPWDEIMEETQKLFEESKADKNVDWYTGLEDFSS